MCADLRTGLFVFPESEAFYTMRKRSVVITLIISLILLLAACSGSSAQDPAADVTGTGQEPSGTESTPVPTAVPTPTNTPTPTQAPLPTSAPTPTPVPDNSQNEVELGFLDDGTFYFNRTNTFYTADVTLTITAPQGSVVYYTLDGSDPDETSSVYDEPLVFKAHGSSFPDASIFRARAMDTNGRWSKTAARTFLAGTKLNGRFSTIVFSISGDPKDLTEGPDGLFYDTNYLLRGRSSERKVYVEAWEANGNIIFEQFAGLRIYGGYNRQATLKSVKLFARKLYDENGKNFKFSGFNTKKLDGSDKVIKKYDKLVLRNCGNDNQFAFIRDELSQRLCEIAGFECFESVLPAVAYLNGSYYNLYWLHESYCDKYFKEKFGDAEGEFVILEGKDQVKDDDDDPLVQTEVNSFNEHYNRFISMDLTDDSNYAQVTAFMDVEDYLNFFAWNICLNNWDWPNNNFKCVRYVEAGKADLAKEDAVQTPSSKWFDGRWRFLVHDMDYSYGLYGQDKTQANYNTLRVVLNKNHERYSPLFAKLMERSDCREYFRNKCYEYFNGPLSEDTIVSTYYKLHNERVTELGYYYEYMERQRRLGESSLWTTENNYPDNEDEIFEFARTRAGYALKYLEELLPPLDAAGQE